MSAVLVTGGCGFLGGWVVRALRRRGHDVRVFDFRPANDHLEFVQPGLSREIEIVAGEVTNKSDVAEAAKDCDSVIHLAGIMTVDCRRDPLRAANINLIGSLNVFEAALAGGMRQVAYVSTAGIYGPEDGTRPLPATHYGALKLAVEGCARAYFVDHGLPSIGFRPYIIYGPGVGSGISAGPSIACRAASRGEEAEILFTGRVGMVHVEDVAEAFAATADVELAGAEAHNLVGEVATIDDFLRELRRLVPSARVSASGKPLLIASDLEIGERPDFLAALSVTGLAQGIERTLAHYRAA
ncbi:NAD(P)-dependent oxidoreductase [Aquamicrobium sp. LC103]|uniref:NAD-dependent epimerase/dehydratase family protein n=1 Tax=Aquamicrobium sp. LC103 TaxID=1120658 RepID=UPI00063ED29E|nr:NAD(P)-dependent oxidoreductase [Aquamicrobium sp. LC103]TKT76192.1 NAD(P)-dependent oxidoreductase [Aquamicrobium sp. LC103]